MVELYCPECNAKLQVLYDERHDETYCKSCGVILRCPPNARIVTPSIIRTEEGEED